MISTAFLSTPLQVFVFIARAGSSFNRGRIGASFRFILYVPYMYHESGVSTVQLLLVCGALIHAFVMNFTKS